jgi:3-oxoacyl-[acyl-carrier protein] reductase
LFRQTIERFGKLDILVNNAAGINIFKPTTEMSEGDYDSMFLITRGVYFALQEAAKVMGEGGRIVSISSAGTSQPMAGGGAYAGSKAAIEQFSSGLAKELGARGITVNTIAPGLTDTDGMVLSSEHTASLIAQTPMGRLGHPEDIADAVSLLVSDQARWITLQHVRVTGGIV